MTAGTRMLASAAELYAIEAGQGPVLLLLHGVTANAYIWLPVMELLADSYHCVAIDQRGHGRTGMPRDDRFDAAAYARDAADLAAFIGHGPVVLVGHSLGARNAIVAGAMRPDAIAGVVAIEFTPFIGKAAFDALDSRVAGGPRSFGDLGDLTGYLTWRYPGLPADAVSRRARHGYAARADGRLAPLADAGAMRATCAGLREDLAADLRRLAVPAVPTAAPTAGSSRTRRSPPRGRCAPTCRGSSSTTPTITCPRSSRRRWPGSSGSSRPERPGPPPCHRTGGAPGD